MTKTDTWLFSRDGGSWQEVTLPHTVFIEPENIDYPQTGTAMYRYSFMAPEEWKEKIIYFEIGAAMQTTQVYLNGTYQFTHEGGYQKFFIPLSDELTYGTVNTLELRLDNSPSRNMPPGKPVDSLDFCYHSGLYRSAGLRIWEPVHITDPLAVAIKAGGGVFIRTEKLNTDGSADLSVTCHVVNEFPAARRFQLRSGAKRENMVAVKMQVTGPDGAVVFESVSDAVEIRPNCDHTFNFGNVQIPAAALWTPDTPSLYQAHFTVLHDGCETDRVAERFGIRTISFSVDGFCLNGVKTFLNGTNRHMEYPFVGNALPANAQRRDAILIKNDGYNFVRLSHYNQDPAFLDACDELGLMMMPAIPGWQAYHGNSTFINAAYRDCRELIRSLRNRPSVVAWEVSLNEAYPPSWINEEFHRIVHEEYPGEGSYSAGDTWGFYEGWDILFPCGHMRSTDKPQILREYGDWTFGGNESTSRRSRGAGKQELLIQTWNFLWSMNRMVAVPGMVGGADWCFFDYNRGCAPDIERSGSMDIYRLPKPKFYFYQSQGDGDAMVYAIHDNVGKLVVFSNCDEVEVCRNGSVIARRTPDDGPDTPYGKNGSPNWETALPDGFDTSGGEFFNGGNGKNLKHPPFTFTGIAPLEQNDLLTVTAYRNGAKAAETVLRKPDGTAVSAEIRVRTEGVEPVSGDLLFVDAIVKDQNGVTIDLPGKDGQFPVKLTASGAEIIGGMEQSEAGIASWLVRITETDYSFSAELI